jgi:hypothetical protein
MGPYGWQDLLAWMAGAAAALYVVWRLRGPSKKSSKKPDVPVHRLLR